MNSQLQIHLHMHLKSLILITFSLLSIAIIIFLLVVRGKKNGQMLDKHFINDEGDHIYYDESMIEKKIFMKQNPEVKDIRTIKRLIQLLFHREIPSSKNNN